MEKIIPYHWTDTLCGKARFLIAPFGYGTKVAAENLASKLNLKIGAWKSNDLSASANHNSVKITFNFGVANPGHKHITNSFCVWVDCLMWLRNKIPETVLNYDLFLAENFFAMNPALYEQSSKIEEIPPLLSFNGHPLNSHFNSQGHILISFGGIETPFTTDVHRYVVPELIMKAIATASEKLRDTRQILCCLPSHISEHFQKNPALSRIQFRSPAHKEFLEILKAASLYVVQPGLYGPFEAFQYGIPTVFTTPFSYTQVCQARRYEQEGICGQIPLWHFLNADVGHISGAIETEENTCFAKMENWIEKYLVKECIGSYTEWALKSLSNEAIASGLTKKRKEYSAKCKKKEHQYLCLIKKGMQ